MIKQSSWPNQHSISSPSNSSPWNNTLIKSHKRALLSILAWWLMSSCGWEWDTVGPTQNNENMIASLGSETEEGRMRIASVAISSVPTSAPFELEGKVGYGWIYFEHPISGYANGPYINPYQQTSYNPRDVLTRLGSTEWIITRASFAYELDRDNNGIVDTTWTIMVK